MACALVRVSLTRDAAMRIDRTARPTAQSARYQAARNAYANRKPARAVTVGQVLKIAGWLLAAAAGFSFTVYGI